MEPTLLSGDELLVNPRAYRTRAPQVGDLVWVQHPLHSDRKMIKRVDRFDSEGRCHVLGDNPGQSTDSRSFGGLPSSRLLGRVEGRLKRSP